LAEIVPVVSESLEAQVRALLPSQRGFGEDLQASNVITPIIDLTAAAQGTSVPEYQAQAVAFGSQTAFSVAGSSSVLANSPGFYAITAAYAAKTSGAYTLAIQMSDGLSTKDVWEVSIPATTTTVGYMSSVFEITVFLRAGDSVSANSASANGTIAGSIRQIADVNGNVVNPVGFTPQ